MLKVRDLKMSGGKHIIQPVWGLGRRNLSSEMLDTAENLVENLDDISDVLDKLTEKYEKETASHAHFEIEKDEDENVVDDETQAHGITINIEEVKEDDEPATPPKPVDPQEEQANERLFLKLKSGLDAARTLIECLRTEKRRMMKRELSVECRIGEIEDYKEHMKNDLTSLNDTIDLLSFRTMKLEDQAVEQQEQVESLEAENLQLKEQLEECESTISDLRGDNDILLQQTITLRRERTNTSLMLENKELKYKVEMLCVENSKLKEMVRRFNEDEIQSVSSEGDLGQSRDTNDNGAHSDGAHNDNYYSSRHYSTASSEDSDSYL